jgi:hypothetical protein
LRLRALLQAGDAKIIVALTGYDRQSGLGGTDMTPALTLFPP